MLARRGLLLVSLVTAAMLLSSQFNIFLSRFFSNYAFSIFAFSLPYTYLANLLLLLFLAVQRHWKIMVIPLIALIFTTGLFSKVMALNFWPESPEKEKKELKVLSWNVALQGYYTKIDHRLKMQSIADAVNEVEPDIVCFQEFVAADAPHERARFIRDSVAEMLMMPYSYYSYDSVYNLGKVNHYGNIIFSKYPIVEESRVSFDTLAYNNNYSYIDVVVQEKKLRVATFHMQSLHLQGAKRELAKNPNLRENLDSLLSYSKSIYGSILGKYNYRVLQSRAVQELEESTETPIIVCGDMNDVPSSYAYYILSHDMEDAFIHAGLGMGRTFRGAIPSLRIDYMFYTPSQIKCTYSEVLKNEDSDHYPLFSKFILN